MQPNRTPKVDKAVYLQQTLFNFILLALFFCGASTVVKADTVYTTNFENFTTTNWKGWSASNGIWEAGTPTSGPGAAHEGVKCMGTVLGGNYPTYKNSRLVSPDITLPSIEPGKEITLNFWHWFQYNSDYDAGYGYVQISAWDGSQWSDWAGISGAYWRDGRIWTYAGIDLSAYAGKKVRLGFVQIGGHYGAPGWYIDEVRVTTQTTKELPLNKTITFEDFTNTNTNWKGWSVDNGIWEVGTPTYGPSTAHEGVQCMGTVLGGNYSSYKGSSLVSPPVTLPSIDAGQSITLNFWQWFQYNSDYDAGYGYVWISTWNGTTWSDATQISGNCWRDARVWTYAGIDLSSYAGKRVKLGFYHVGGHYQAPGWYLDEVRVSVQTTKELPLNKAVTFEDFTNTNTNWKGWSVDNGIWEVGTPTYGPSTAHEGVQCMGTVLGGNYSSYKGSSLVSPPITLPSIDAGQQMTLKFWQWFRYNQDYDAGYGYVWISTWDGATWSDATQISETYRGDSGGWQYVGTNYAGIDLSAYAGKRVKLGFYHVGGHYQAPGWYIDQVSIVW